MRKVVKDSIIILIMIALDAACDNTWAIDEQNMIFESQDPNRFVDKNSGIEAEPDRDRLMDECSNADAAVQSECMMSKIKGHSSEGDNRTLRDD